MENPEIVETPSSTLVNAQTFFLTKMVNFASVKELARRELSEFLDNDKGISGTKVLVWDESLTGPMDLIAKYQFFKDRSVIKMFPLKSGRLPRLATQHIVFITRPDLGQMDKIADNVKGEEMNSSGTEFHILFVPHKSLLCEMRLKDRGVFGSFSHLNELSIGFFPLDVDVISMERPSTFKDFHLKQDPTSLNEVAKAMMSLQALYGFPPRVFGKGQAAKKLFDFMSRMRKEMQNQDLELNHPQFDTMIIIDRQVDMITPLLTQLTYEGLIDELWGIQNSAVKLPAEKFSPDTSEDNATGAKKTLVLNSNEELFYELRDKNFNAVGPTLSRKARSISTAFEERHGAKTVQEFKSFVDKLPQMQSLKQSVTNHTSIAELIKQRTDASSFLEFLQVEQELVNYQNIHRPLDFVEDAACQNLDLLKLLRIICLQCVIGNGLKPKVLEHYRKLILQSYGQMYLSSLINLEKANLLFTNQSPSASSTYSVLRKRLNLTQDDVNEQDPSDIAYVHSVYAPMSVRLVQQCAKPGWKTIRDILDLLPGPSFDEYQSTMKTASSSSKQSDEIKKTLVVFIGGCTYAEISALRFLSQQEEAPHEYMIATTSVINGNSLIKDILLANTQDSLASQITESLQQQANIQDPLPF